MIKLFDGWVIDADNCCYILGQPKEYVNKKGEVAINMTSASYHPTIKRAVECLMGKYQREFVKTHDINLVDGLKGIEKINHKFLKKMSEIEKLEK